MLSFKSPLKPIWERNSGGWMGQICIFARSMRERFGEWNYPLGVTLYGMIQTARYEHDNALECYVRGHMEKCTGFYEYCMWDKESTTEQLPSTINSQPLTAWMTVAPLLPPCWR